jgi:hypothetical protein
LRFLGIDLRVLRLEVSVYNVYVTNQFQTTFTQGGRGRGVMLIEVTVHSKEKKTRKTSAPIMSKNSASEMHLAQAFEKGNTKELFFFCTEFLPLLHKM